MLPSCSGGLNSGSPNLSCCTLFNPVVWSNLWTGRPSVKLYSQETIISVSTVEPPAKTLITSWNGGSGQMVATSLKTGPLSADHVTSRLSRP
jgi:hypothetical protein